MNCPVCGGECYSMGILGNLEWFRCRDCGNECEAVTNEYFDEENEDGQ